MTEERVGPPTVRAQDRPKTDADLAIAVLRLWPTMRTVVNELVTDPLVRTKLVVADEYVKEAIRIIERKAPDASTEPVMR